MNDPEKTRKETIDNVRYLKNKGFDEKYLSQIHHNDKETYKSFFDYWVGKIKKIKSDNNFVFAKRIKYIVDKHKETEDKFINLVNDALKKYPK